MVAWRLVNWYKAENFGLVLKVKQSRGEKSYEITELDKNVNSKTWITFSQELCGNRERIVFKGLGRFQSN